jgi:anaerobic ribonucleoside-triphosphate reductase
MKNKLQIPCEIYSRVVGYYRPVSQWNKGKQAEFKNRKTYTVEKFYDKTES